MSYFIFNKQANNQIYKIAENDSDLNALIIPQEAYLVVNNINQDDFNAVKLGTKIVLNYNGSSIQLENITMGYDKQQLQEYINSCISAIDSFLLNQPQSTKYNEWFNYCNFLKTLDVNTIIINPETTLFGSLEYYLNDKDIICYNTFLQVP
jgi:hypothetical protein